MATPRRRLLELCARPELTPAATEALTTHLRHFSDWDRLPEEAAHERMAPLLSKHLMTLSAPIPPVTRRHLMAQVVRQRALSARQQHVLRRVAHVCRNMGIDPIRLKGAGLVGTVYADTTLRPMDDLDLLVPPADVDKVRSNLLAHGFVGPPPGGPEERPHHAAPIYFRDDGFVTTVELHRYLPASGVAERWEQLRPNAVPCTDIPGTWTPHPKDCLWQVYHHAFRSSLRWTPWRLVWIADLVGLLSRGAAIDTPPCGLAALHGITPLPEDVLSRLGGAPLQHSGTGENYHGWPYHKLSPRTLWRALTPPAWWLHMRHGIDGANKHHCLRQHYRDLWHERGHPWDGIACA